MKINSIKINGFKALQSFEVELNGESLELRGDNGMGKSSVIDAIWVALTGNDIPQVPVHREAVKASIGLGLDNGYTVTWKCSAGKKELVVEGPDGRVPEPRKFLDAMIGRIAFDVFEFVDKAPGKQKEEIQKLLGLDLSDLDAAKRRTLDEKKDAEATVASLERQINAMGEVSNVAPVDVQQLLLAQEHRNAVGEKLAGAKNKIAQSIESMDSKARDLEEAKRRVSDLESAMIGIQADINTARAIRDDAQAEFDALPDPAPQIATASEANVAASRYQQKVQLRREWGNKAQVVEAAKLKLEGLEQERIRRLAAAPWPVQGLAFSDDGLLFNGLPFTRENQCMSDIVKVGVAIAVAQNPALKIVRVKDGSLLGKAKREELLAAMREHGYQVFLEMVTEDKELKAIVLEEVEAAGFVLPVSGKGE